MKKPALKPLLLFALLFSLAAGEAKDDASAMEMGPAVNSAASEISPVISPDGETLFFGSDRTAAKSMDIYTSKISGGKWRPAEALPAQVNTTAYELPGSWSHSENALYFHRCPQEYNPQGCDMWMAKLGEKGWEDPRPLKELNTGGIEASPSVSLDGTLLLFVSDRKGGMGAADVWASRRQSIADPWGEPFNLGPEVNTSREEAHCFLQPDGQTFFFSSRGHGADGVELFRGRLIGRQVYEVEKTGLGEGGELGFSVGAAGIRAYLSRQNGTAGWDVFELVLPASFAQCNLVLVKGHVLDAESSQGIAAEVRLLDAETRAELTREKSGTDGLFHPATDRDRFILEVGAEGYETHAETIEVPPHQDCALVLREVKLKKKSE